MSFSSDEEDGVSTSSQPSWIAILSSQFGGSSLAESSRLSADVPPFDRHQSINGVTDSKYSDRLAQVVKMETRSQHSSLFVGGESSKCVDRSTEFPAAIIRETNSLNQQARKSSPPRSPAKEGNKIMQFPQGGFSNYHDAFRPPPELLDSERSSNNSDSNGLEMSARPPSFTSNLFVTLENRHDDPSLQGVSQSITSTTSSNSSSEHPYGSISLKLKSEFSAKENEEEILHGGKSSSDDFLPSGVTENSNLARPTRPLTVKLPDGQSSKRSGYHQRNSTRSQSVPSHKPRSPRMSNRSFSSPSPDSNIARGVMSTDPKAKLLFYGDGLFDVAKERDEEAAAFSVMMSQLRSNFHWNDDTNPGHVISPTVPYDYETFPRFTEARMVIYSKGRHDTLKFIFNAHSRVSKIIELALSCFLDDGKSINGSQPSAYVLKVCGRAEYLQGNDVLIQYGYVQGCVKFGSEVELVLLPTREISRQLVRTEEDDQDDSLPRSYKDFFDCPVNTAVSKYGVTVLLEAFNDELVRLVEATTSTSDRRFEPSRVIQAVKAICATLASLETEEVINSVQMLKNLQNDIPPGRMIPDQASVYDALLKLQEAVLLLVEMYCDAFDTAFVPTRADRPKLAGSIEVTAMTDNLRIHVAFANRLPLSWKQDFDRYEVQCGIYYGGRLSCPVEVTQPRKIAKHFFDQLRWDEWLQFKIQVRQLPRESRLCLTLYGFSPVAKGNSSNPVRTPLGWVAVPLFNFKGLLVSGTQLLGLWPEDTANPVGSCTSNLLHPSSVILQVEFERYLADIVFPDFESNGLSVYDETDRCEPHDSTTGVYKQILERDRFNELKPEEKELLWDHRYYCMSVPKALPLILAAAPSWEYQYLPVIYGLLSSWAPLKPVDAMELLKVSFPDIRVRATAVEWLEGLVDDELCDYLPQLVQALKYEIYHDSSLIQFLVRRALGSVRVMHYLFWYLKDTISDPQFGQRFQIILGGLLSICGNAQRCEFTRQDEVLADLTHVAVQVKNAKDSSRTNILQQELAVVAANMFTSVRLPVDPSYEVKGVDLTSCDYFNSNSAPLKLIFKNADQFGEDVHAMLKIGDDLRQDKMVMQLVGIINKIWLRDGIDLKMITYKCVATGVGMGMVEIVKESATLREIHTELGLTGSFKDEPIARWIQKYNPGEESYYRAVENFTASCAGYCVATYILGIGDRHNDNIMIKKSGHLFHIDFAKILGNAQMFGSFRRDRAPFVLTPDMAFVINGGYEPSSRFQDFVDLCCMAFNVIRRHSNLLLNLLSLMLNSGISCLSKIDDLKYIRDSLLPGCSDGEATTSFTRLIECSLSSWFTQVNFFIHNVAQIRDVSQLRRPAAVDNSSSVLSFVRGTYSVDTDGLIDSARVVDFQKRYNPEKYYIYLVNICRDGVEEPSFVFRRFRHFHELHLKLTQAFPEITLPRLPNKIYIGRSQIRAVAERRRNELDHYIRHLLMMPTEVSESELLYTFLHARQQDKGDASSFSVRLLPEEKRNRERPIGGKVKLWIQHECEALRVMVMHAKELSPRNQTSPADPYVKLYLLPDPVKATKLKTRIARKTLNPTFNETLVYNMSEWDVRERILQVTVLDHDYVGENEFLGGVLIDLSQIDLKTSTASWYTLTDIRKPR